MSPRRSDQFARRSDQLPRRSDQLHLNAFLKPPGEYLDAWRHPDTAADAGVNIREVLSFARIAEQATFDAVFLADLVGVLFASEDVLSSVSVVNDSFKLGEYHELFGHELTGISVEHTPAGLKEETLERFAVEVAPAIRAAQSSRVWAD